jgi:hypothetical protein
MNIQFVRNIQFTRVIKAHQRLREFNFLKHNTEPYSYFSVDTVDDRGNRITFRMFDSNGKWRIKEVPVIPEWIYEEEPKLHNVIMEETL